MKVMKESRMMPLLPILQRASGYAPFVHKDFQFQHVRTRPLDYLPGTIVHRASETLNRQGSYGLDRLSVLTLPKNEAGIHDPGFISAWKVIFARTRKDSPGFH